MRRIFIILLALALTYTSIQVNAETLAPVQPKEWTILIYLNGNNNLDSFGAMNINQMEKVGSTAKVNVIVQWASLAAGKTERLYITKDNDTTKVTSKVVQNMGKVDMGDYKSVIDFVKWGAQNYPAQHYFVDIWDHGSGWHFTGDHTVLKDISWDDTTGNHITTEQLATALTESSKILGQKIDIYGSDACMMGMAEVADQVSDAVGVYVGSEETEPGDGWPYDLFLTAWNNLPAGAPASDVSKALTAAYATYYKAQSGSKVTLASYDLSLLAPLTQSIKNFAASFKNLSAAELAKVNAAAKKATSFADEDYVDLGDFMDQIKSLKLSTLSAASISDIGTNAKNFVLSADQVGYPKTHGLSIWIPTDSTTYSTYADRYSQLKFDHDSNWSDVAKLVSQSAK